MPQVSVLVAAFNAATSIEATLASIAQQSFEDWECVVVDDGSTDATANLVHAYATVDPRFRLLRRPHQGVVAARNHGIECCRSDLIAILDADDLMLPERLALQVTALATTPTLAAIGCHVRYQPRDAVGQGRLAYENWLNSQHCADDIQRDRYIEMPVGHPTMTFRKSVLQRLRYRTQDWPEDWDLLLRLLDEGFHVGVVPRILHTWGLSKNSLSQQCEDYRDSSFSRCRAAFLASGFLSHDEDYALLGYGNTGKRLRADLRRHRKSCQLIVELHPGRIGQCIEGAKVVHHDFLRQQHVKQRILVSVAGIDARTTIRKMLCDFGYTEGRDFVCTA